MEKSSSPSDPAADEEYARVHVANETFYKAFESLDISRMAEVWQKSDRVKCVHPGGELLAGREAVMKSWEDIFSNTLSVHFDLSHVSIDVRGDLAWVTLHENVVINAEGAISKGMMIATNIYERSGDRWLLLHHHAAASPMNVPSSRSKPTLH